MATTYDFIAANKRKSIGLIVVFILIVGLIGWTISYLLEQGPAGLVFAVILAVVMSLVGYYSGDRIALATSGAQGPMTKADNAYVYNLVENLSITNGQPMPRLYIIPDENINAFATGRDPEHASIAVTTGAIQKLENEELEGVLAHELSHVKNYDIRFMTLVLVLVGVVTIISDLMFRSIAFSGGRRDSRGNGGPLAIVGIVVLILSPLIAQLIKLAVSRRREFLADASGALLTRYPEGLAKALEKIERSSERPLARATNATAHLYISNPFGPQPGGFAQLFSTHPPLAERIKALRSMGGIS